MISIVPLVSIGLFSCPLNALCLSLSLCRPSALFREPLLNARAKYLPCVRSKWVLASATPRANKLGICVCKAVVWKGFLYKGARRTLFLHFLGDVLNNHRGLSKMFRKIFELHLIDLEQSVEASVTNIST